MSRTRTIANLIAAEINSLTLPQTVDQVSPLAKAAVSPRIARETDEKLRVFVTFAGRTIAQNVQVDRCSSSWSSQFAITLSKRLDAYDSDQEQPANLDDIDALVENAEYIAEHLANAKFLAGGEDVASLSEIDHPVLVSNDWLTEDSMFYSEIVCSYQ